MPSMETLIGAIQTLITVTLKNMSFAVVKTRSKILFGCKMSVFYRFHTETDRPPPPPTAKAHRPCINSLFVS